MLLPCPALPCPFDRHILLHRLSFPAVQSKLADSTQLPSPSNIWSPLKFGQMPNIIKQSAFIHVHLHNISMGCLNLVHINLT